jgi:hypothetical protein
LHGFQVHGSPILHFSSGVDVVVWPMERLAEPSKDLSSRSRTSNPLFKKPGAPASEPHR